MTASYLRDRDVRLAARRRTAPGADLRHETHRSERAAATAVIAIGAFGVAGALGVALPIAGVLAMGVVGLTVVFFAASSEPAMLAVLSMPLLCSVQRLGGDALELSVGDAVLFVVFMVMAFLGPRPLSPALRAVLWLTVFYQVTTIFTVLVHPYPANAVEWTHAWLLTAGAIIVGWSAGRRGYGSAALTLLVLTAAAISLLAVGVALARLSQGVLEEVYLEWPFPMHKNVIGTLAAFSAIVVYARPPWLGWPKWATTPMFVLLCAGMLAAQSRQAIFSVVVAVVLIALRGSSMAARSRAVLIPMFAAVVAAGLTVAAQFSEANQFNSVYQRLDWYAQSTEVWKMNPWFGMGLRWWYTGLLPEEFQPPQAVLEMLSSAGIVGLFGFVVMFGGFMFVLWRRLPPQYGTLAVAMVLSRVVQGQLDQFWITVQVSVPLVIMGICIGAYDHASSLGENPGVEVLVLGEPDGQRRAGAPMR